METFYFLAILIITMLIHFALFALNQFDRKKKQEKAMIENAGLILDKLDKMKRTGGNKMNEDMKKLAKYLAGKIESAKEEIIDTIEENFESLSEDLSEEDTELEDKDKDFEDDNPFDELDEEPDEEEKEEKPKKEMPESMDITKRQIKNEMEVPEPTKKKKGLFRIGGKK